MRTDKKLKRGLAELSRLFSQSHESALWKRDGRVVSVEPPQNDAENHEPPQLICSTFLQSSEIFRPTDFFNLADILKSVFQEIYFLSTALVPSQHETLAQAFPIPAWERVQKSSDIQLRSVGERVTFGHIPPDQFQEIVQPRISSNRFRDLRSSQKALAIFDSVFSSPPASNVFELMDHCVFIVSPDSNQLIETYEQVKHCLRQNKFARYSLLLAGRHAEALWEFVYGRFNEIVSRFLGCDLGFLGWVEGKEMHLNPELLLEEGRNLIQGPSKASLSEALWRPILNS